MAENVKKLPVQKEEKTTPGFQAWEPFESLRGEIDRLFEDFGRGLWQPFRRPLFGAEPLFPRRLSWATMPAIDVAESESVYEITAELPGMDEKNVEIKMSDGQLIIKGEKKEEKEEKEKDYYLHERHFGSFERQFDVPESVDADKIEAKFKKGVLTVTLPKKPEAKKPVKKIEVKAA